MIIALAFSFLAGYGLSFWQADKALRRITTTARDHIAFWRDAEVKARRDAVEAQKRWLDMRNDEMTKADWWRHTED